MNGLHCTSDDFYALIDGTLSREGRAEAVAHMEACTACTSRYQFLKRFERSVQSLPLITTEAGFTDALMSKLDLSLPAPRTYRVFTWIACQVGLLVAAAVVGAVFTATGLIQPDRVEAGKGVAGDILTAIDGAVAPVIALLAGWVRALIPAGSLAAWSGTAVVILLLVLLDRNFSRRTLHRIR